jgi:hypothetical protein
VHSEQQAESTLSAQSADETDFSSCWPSFLRARVALLVVAAPECSGCIGKLLRILKQSPSLPPWARQQGNKVSQVATDIWNDLRFAFD